MLGLEYSREEMGDVGPVPPPAPSERPATATLRNVVAPTATADAGPEATPVVDAVSEVLTDVPDARTNEGRAARLANIAAVIGDEGESSKDLTVIEVSAVTDSFQADKQAAQTTDADFAAAAGETDPWEGYVG